ncbi:hypothetical protein JCM15579A_22560 [Marinifilum fragile]
MFIPIGIRMIPMFIVFIGTENMIPSGSHVLIVAYSINMQSLRDSIEKEG